MTIEGIKKSLADGQKLVLTVRARPNAAKSLIVGFMADDSLKVAIKATPEEGKANQELRRLLAKELAVPQGIVTIISGATSRLKLVKIDPNSIN